MPQNCQFCNAKKTYIDEFGEPFLTGGYFEADHFACGSSFCAGMSPDCWTERCVTPTKTDAELGKEWDDAYKRRKKLRGEK